MLPERHGRFQTTRWSLILAAADSADVDRTALNALCELYWYPVYGFIRRHGVDASDAEDLTQAFFERMIEKNYLAQADRQRGRFRSFLLAAVKHFMSNDRAKARAQKRGGGVQHVPLTTPDSEEWHAVDVAGGLTPEEIFEKRAAFAILDAAVRQLRAGYEKSGSLRMFERLVPFMTGSADEDYDAAARDLGMSNGAARIAVHRMRRRFRAALRKLVQETVVDPSDVDDEIRHFLDVVAVNR